MRIIFSPWLTIVGVVGDVRHTGLNTAPNPEMYLSQLQEPQSSMAVLARTTGDPLQLAGAAREQLKAMDKDLPVFSVKTMNEYLATAVAAPRFNTTLLSIFATVALVLTIVGLYGVMSYSVAQRTSEIGIRLALGAQTSDVLKMVVRQGITLVVLGLSIGLLAAVALMRVVSGLLFGVTARDPFTLATVALLLAAIALLACLVPAWHATRVDPMEALRCE
jgi:putative ABC transport system permease protein